eukprot:SAG31_NODE_45524_length_258_cov_0.981132_1_plen_56_part_01
MKLDDPVVIDGAPEPRTVFERALLLRHWDTQRRDGTATTDPSNNLVLQDTGTIVAF